MPSDKLFPKGYWSKPSIDYNRSGDANSAFIFHAVGVALSSWEGVEESLVTLFLVACKVSDTHAAIVLSESLGLIESNGVKLKILENAVILYFGHYWKFQEVRSDFLDLKRCIELAGHRRNEIAHGKVLDIQINSSDADGLPVANRLGAYLVAASYATGRHQPFHRDIDPNDKLIFIRSNYRYTSADIIEFAGKFNALQLKIYDYIQKISLHESKIPKNVYELIVNNIISFESNAAKQPRKETHVDGNSKTPL